jgi:hyperosmotically inducible protein
MRFIVPVKTFLAVLALSLSLAACSVVSNQETAGNYVDDAAITAKVKTAIFEDPSLKSMQVGVETMKNVVQLSGFVDSQQNRFKAGDLARGVQGVRSVKNDLIVR